MIQKWVPELPENCVLPGRLGWAALVSGHKHMGSIIKESTAGLQSAWSEHLMS